MNSAFSTKNSTYPFPVGKYPFFTSIIFKLTFIFFIKGIKPNLTLYKGGDRETSLPPSIFI